jgi:hypothetical protein
MTCGIPNSVLIAHDIDPVILIDLPEDIEATVLSEINWYPPGLTTSPVVTCRFGVIIRRGQVSLTFLLSRITLASIKAS